MGLLGRTALRFCQGHSGTAWWKHWTHPPRIVKRTKRKSFFLTGEFRDIYIFYIYIYITLHKYQLDCIFKVLKFAEWYSLPPSPPSNKEVKKRDMLLHDITSILLCTYIYIYMYVWYIFIFYIMAIFSIDLHVFDCFFVSLGVATGIRCSQRHADRLGWYLGKLRAPEVSRQSLWEKPGFPN